MADAQPEAVPVHPAPAQGLFSGLLPPDLPALRQSAGRFLARLERLTDDLAGGGVGERLGWWLAGATSLVAGFEFARRLQRRPLAELPPCPRQAFAPVEPGASAGELP